MTRAIGTLSIDLEARLGRMEESLAKAERASAKSAASIKASLGSIGDVGGKLTAVFAGLAGSLSVGAIVAGVRAVVGGLDDLNDAADATGASVELLSALEDLGRRTGTSFGTVTGILVKFNAQLKEAGEDANSGAARALRALGLEVDELRRMDPAAALQKTAQAMAGFAADGDKARLTQELFGKSVREAAPFLKDLAEAGQLNATVTKEQTDQAERFNKAIGALQASLVQFARTLLSDAIPAMAEFFELANKRGGFFSAWWEKGEIASKSKFAALKTQEAGDITAEIERLSQTPRAQRSIYQQDKIAGLYRDLERVNRAAREANEEVKRLLQGPDFKAPAPPTTKQLLLGNQGYGELPSVVLPTKEKKPGRPKEPPELEAPKRLRLDTKPLGGEVNKVIADANRLADTWERQAEMAQRFQDQLVTQTQDLNAGLITDARARGEAQIEIDRQVLQRQLDALQLYGTDRARIQDAINANIAARQAALLEQIKPEWQRLLEGWQDTAAHMAKSWDELMNGVVAHGEDVLAKFIRTGKLSVADFADFVQQAIARMLAQKAMAQIAGIADVLFGGGLGGGLAKGGIVSRGEIQPFATGGIVSRPTYFPMTHGRMGLMGEASPEAVLPLKRGANGKLGVASSGQAGPTVIVNLPMGVTRAELAAFVPMLKQQIANELVVRMRRPGFAGL